jgi:hypothetical protein
MKNNVIKITLLAIGICIANSLKAQNLIITPIYEVIKNTNSDAWVDKFTMVKEIPIQLTKKQLIKIKKTKNDYTEWQISDGKNQGKISFDKSDSEIWWDFSFKGETWQVLISSGSQDVYNDPRELWLCTKTDTLYIANAEPDCNSVFYLFDQKEYGFGDKNQGEARAQKACNKTPWKIKLNSQLTENQKIAFIFTATVCMTLRYMPYLLKKDE